MAQHAHNLVRAVIRAFYTDGHVVAVEGLLRAPFYVMDDNKAVGEMFNTYSMRPLVMRKYLQELLAHGLVQRLEFKGRNYWYVHLPLFIKLVRYRLDALRLDTETLDSTSATDLDIYFCPTCMKSFSIESASSVKFHCDECRQASKLQSKVRGPSLSTNEALKMQEKYKAQICARTLEYDAIIDLLKRCDDSAQDIPTNDPILELEKKYEVELALKFKMDARKAAIERGEIPPDDENGTQKVNSSASHVSILFGKEISTAQSTSSAPKELPPWYMITATGEKSSVAQDAVALAESSAKRIKPEPGASENPSESAMTLAEESIRKQQQLSQEYLQRLQQGSSSSVSSQAEGVKQEGLEVKLEPKAKMEEISPMTQVDEIFVLAGGKRYRLIEVTEEIENLMSETEYDDYFRITKDA